MYRLVKLFDKEILTRAIKSEVAYIDITKGTTQTKRGIIVEIPEKWEVNKDEKSNLCGWICQYGTKDDFINFEQIFEIIEKIIREEKK